MIFIYWIFKRNRFAKINPSSINKMAIFKAISSTSSVILFRPVPLILLMIAYSSQATATNAINDVNNILRDSSNKNHNSKTNNSMVADLVSSSALASNIGDFGGHLSMAEMLKAKAEAAQISIVENRGNNHKHSNILNNDNNNLAYSENSIDDTTNSIESGEILRFVDDRSVETADNDETLKSNDGADDGMLPLRDQVRLLTKQLNALMMRRRDDYEMLERNLRKSLRQTAEQFLPTTNTKAAKGTSSDMDIRSELEQLRREVQILRDGHLLNGNKEKLTIDWLAQSVAEIRKQLVELQQIASEANKDISLRTQSFEDLATIRSDFRQLKLEMAAMHERQERVEVFVQELLEEMQQQEEDYTRLLHNYKRQKWSGSIPKNQHVVQKVETEEAVKAEDMQRNKSDQKQRREKEDVDGAEEDTKEDNYQLNTHLLADHKRRHIRFNRQQIHELQLAQRDLKRQLNELKYHRIAERVRAIEIEQHRIADASFNLSRQIASLDKLHSSMLELLEDVEGLQNKVDKSVPELRHEISKLEFSHAQLNSEQSLLKEEGKNVARSVQAMAVSISALQEERDGVRAMHQTLQQLSADAKRAQNSIDILRQTMMMQKQQQEQQQQHQNQRQFQLKGQKPEVSAVTTETHTQASHEQRQEQEQSGNQNYYDNDHHNDTAHLDPLHRAENLMMKLENVELQYESLISNLPHDCSAIESTSSGNGTGLYLIAPAGQHHPIMTHCERDGWTTVQRRYDGSVDFNRSWENYATGFGSPSGEYWIGNEQLHALTQNNCTTLRIRMQDIYDNVWIAEYAHFYVSPRSDGYRLHVSGYAGNASDALDYQQGMQFSAIDVDRDISQTHCAANYEGGWWFSHCQHANLNGRYNLGLTWFDAARNEWIAVKSSQMLVKRLPASECVALTRVAVAAGQATDVDADGETTKTKTFDSVSASSTVAASATAAKSTHSTTTTKSSAAGDAFVVVTDEVTDSFSDRTSTTNSAVV